MMRALVALLFVMLINESLSLRFPVHFSRRTLRRSSDGSTFDGQEFEKVLRSMGPQGAKMQPSSEFYNNLKNDQAKSLSEDIFRKYPFDATELPTLPDCDNYYSGKYGDYIWHQNADQVFVYIPIDETVERKNIQVKFAAKSVSVNVNEVEIVCFPCTERIIPDGSFWTFERDKDNKRYIHLDMEKRYRMINWKGIFGDQSAEADDGGSEKRSRILEKLFAANQGMSKLSGIPPESMQEMMSNGDLTRMIADEVYTRPQVTTIAEDGSESQPFIMENNSAKLGKAADDSVAVDAEIVDSSHDSYADAYDEGAYEDTEGELRLKEMEVLDAEIVVESSSTAHYSE